MIILTNLFKQAAEQNMLSIGYIIKQQIIRYLSNFNFKQLVLFVYENWAIDEYYLIRFFNVCIKDKICKRNINLYIYHKLITKYFLVSLTNLTCLDNIIRLFYNVVELVIFMQGLDLHSRLEILSNYS